MCRLHNDEFCSALNYLAKLWCFFHLLLLPGGGGQLGIGGGGPALAPQLAGGGVRGEGKEEIQ